MVFFIFNVYSNSISNYLLIVLIVKKKCFIVDIFTLFVCFCLKSRKLEFKTKTKKGKEKSWQENIFFNDMVEYIVILKV